jgi:hypothetical protein
MTQTQNQQILASLKNGNSITPADALNDFGCFRLAARIYQLKQDGHDIQSELIEVDAGKRVASYWLKKAKPPAQMALELNNG